MDIEQQIRQAEPGRVLELGTYQWEAGRATDVARIWWPDLAEHVRSDISEGPGVDVAADAHDLAPFDDCSFDVVLSRSVHEHLARPWTATAAMARVLRSGGLLYIDTHQTFPLHGYPDDYFRFSTDALAVLMGDAGLDVIATDYVLPCRIVPDVPVAVWNEAAPCYLHVRGIGRKP
jgi:SAM-dependent methyltransferase